MCFDPLSRAIYSRMRKFKRFLISTYFWTATITSLFPAILFLVVNAGDWPNNWDDFQRLFNGISPEHKINSYGIDVSNDMMKLAVHDPVLTLSNRLRFQFPLLSILAEVVLLISPLLVFSRLAYLRGEILLCIAMSMGFSGLMVVHTVYLPPAAYPLGFSLAFCSTLFISIELIRYFLYKDLPLTITITVMVIEQMSFIFYASCYLQSVFITLIGILITMPLSKQLLTKRELLTVGFVHAIRFSIFPLITAIWRLSHDPLPAESLSPELKLIGTVHAMLKWSSGGTLISKFWGMGTPEINLVDNLKSSETLLLLLLISLTFSVCLAMWSKLSLNTHRLNYTSTDIKNIFFEKLNPYLATGLIGLSICLAWSLPIVSSRYYSEMQQVNSQIYAAMRYSSLGLILVIMSTISYLFKSFFNLINNYIKYFGARFNSTDITKIFVVCFFPFWLYGGLVNINSLYTEYHFAPYEISLKSICNREIFTTNDYIALGKLVPSSVIDIGVDGWLPSLNTEKNNIDNLEEFIGKTFIQNSLRLCEQSKSR